MTRGYSLDELHAELGRYEAELRDAGMADATITTYVDRAERFLRWLSGDYTPGRRE
jgi:hypothetical protein